MTVGLLAVVAHIPVSVLAQGESRWVAYLWVAGIAALVVVIVWMLFTGKFRRRGGPHLLMKEKMSRNKNP